MWKQTLKQRFCDCKELRITRKRGRHLGYKHTDAITKTCAYAVCKIKEYEAYAEQKVKDGAGLVNAKVHSALGRYGSTGESAPEPVMEFRKRQLELTTSLNERLQEIICELNEELQFSQSYHVKLQEAVDTWESQYAKCHRAAKEWQAAAESAQEKVMCLEAELQEANRQILQLQDTVRELTHRSAGATEFAHPEGPGAATPSSQQTASPSFTTVAPSSPSSGSEHFHHGDATAPALSMALREWQ